MVLEHKYNETFVTQLQDCANTSHSGLIESDATGVLYAFQHIVAPVVIVINGLTVILFAILLFKFRRRKVFLNFPHYIDIRA